MSHVQGARGGVRGFPRRLRRRTRPGPAEPLRRRLPRADGLVLPDTRRGPMRRDRAAKPASTSHGGKSLENVGAWILGRNMFGPVRGPGPTRLEGLVGRGAAVPLSRSSCSRITRADPLEMKGGTEFHFVTGGIQAALARARLPPVAGTSALAAGWPPFASTCARAHRRAAPCHAPVFLGRGENLFVGLDLRALEMQYPQQSPVSGRPISCCGVARSDIGLPASQPHHEPRLCAHCWSRAASLPLLTLRPPRSVNSQAKS